MTGQHIERHQATSTQLARAEDERRWEALTRRATALSKAGTLVPKAIQGNPDAALAACLVLDASGVSITPVTLKQLHFIDGVPEPSAQLQAGMLGAHGYAIDWIEISPQRCEARLVRPDGTLTTTVTWTIDQARHAGLLDSWVERWTKVGDRNRYEKFVLGREGVDTPEWVDNLVRAGATKRMENWHRFPDDMLASKVVRRLVKRFVAQIMLGVGAFDDLDDEISSPAAPQAAVPTAVTTAGEDHPDDNIIDAEIVHDPSPAATTAQEPTGEEHPHGEPGELVDARWLQRFAIKCTEITPAGHQPADVRHAIAITVTKGRSRSSKGILAGSEAERAMKWAAALAAGRARLEPYPLDPAFYVVVAHQPETGDA